MTDNNRYPRPDYDNCLVNLSNSILKRFGAKTTAPTLKMVDEILEGDCKNVVVLLLDAMGISIIERHLKPDGFLRSHLVGEYSSVFPPTTVAATTSFMSGLYPNEHGWLGWDMYFPQIDKNVAVFRNNIQHEEDPEDTAKIPRLKPDVPAADFNVARRYCPYEPIIDKINKAGGQAYYSMPFEEPFPQDLDAILKRTSELCEKPGKKFIYAYWNEPDSTMHRVGVDGEGVYELLNELEAKVEAFAEGLKDTLLIVTADHGHMNNVNRCILDYPEILECLKRMPSIEPRTVNFFVKEDCREKFRELFTQTFKDKYWLLTRQEILDLKLFGIGEDHKQLSEFLGDFVAVAVEDESLFVTHIEAALMPGAHAGLTREELEIPLIAIKR